MSRHVLSAIFWGLLFIAAGVLMLLNSLGVIEFQIGQWWPAIFIVIGVQIIIDSIGKQRKDK